MEAAPKSHNYDDDVSRRRTHIAIAVCGCGHDGRLGLGSCDSQSRVTLIPFFLSGNNNDVDNQLVGTIRAVRVGGYHNFAITTTGVYGWGLNENGQLGLGHGSPAYVPLPMRIPFFDKSDVIEIACGAYHTFAWTHEGLFACGKNEDGQLGLSGEKDHIEFTTVLTAAQANNSDATGHEVNGGCRLIRRGQLTHVSCGTHHTLLAFRDVEVEREKDSEVQKQHYPILIAAAGKGDFGELGYDGDAWSVLQAKAKSMQAALRADAQQHQQQQHDNDSTVTVQGLPEKKWKPLKQRRAVFSSEAFQPVGLPLLLERAAASSCVCPFEIVSLHAMHLHSSVVLRDTSAVERDAGVGCMQTFHWGCYYCNAVEDDASSIPRSAGEEVCLHAGNETLFRYNAATAPCMRVEVMGSGVLGLGEEDSFKTVWVPLPLPPEAEGHRVSAITGREHYLILLNDTLVVGFGDNMFGQLGVDDKMIDVVLRPTVVLRVGDHLRSPSAADGNGESVWGVESIRDVGCGVRHSVFLVEVYRQPADVTAEADAVVKGRAVL
ncbi:chromatin binding protein [Trypanosoma grayi]|uniref:chromatin binding protein n=1 Tax=Trypanosoma grayi TaxID=71804 RepID=UPI0004F42B1C|nr:chromatin binding protein [Trypanosoma grayi]KEG13686.1 chromatin binding protein [Trypanosoma grayi]